MPVGARGAGAAAAGALAPAHYNFFWDFFKLLIFTYFINISYLKKIYIKMYRKGADASTAYTGRDADRGTHAHTHYTDERRERPLAAARRNIHKYKL